MARPKPNITILHRLEEQIFYSPDGCWYWLGCCIRKYGSIYYNRNERVHRVAYRVYVGDIPKGLQVLHRCDNPLCVNPDHLFLGTNDDNVKDKVSKNRQFKGAIGELGPNAKLTNNDVIKIKSYKSKVRSVEVGKMFGVSQSTVCGIWYGRIWNHL